MPNPTYTPEEIDQVLEEAVSLVRVSGGKRTPGVLNRLALIEIIEQLQGTKENKNG